MAEPETPENKDNPASTNSSNDDWKAKYETEVKAHDVTTKQRNMYKNQVDDLSTKFENLGKEKDTVSAELDRVKTEAERTAKQTAAQNKQSEILSKFKPETRELAKDLGIELPDAEDEDAINKFEAKLQKLDSTATPDGDEPAGDKKPKAPPVSGNNRRLDDAPPAKAKTEDEELAEMEEKLKDVKF